MFLCHTPLLEKVALWGFPFLEFGYGVSLPNGKICELRIVIEIVCGY